MRGAKDLTVSRMDPPEARFPRLVDRRADDECWEWKGLRDKQGYGWFYCNGSPRRAHRFAWFYEHGVMPPSDIFVCHRCDNPPCCNPAHLFLGTAADNNRDAVAKGRQHGNPHPWPHKRRLSDDDVAAIRAAGNPYPGYRFSLAHRFGVSYEHIRAIQLGRRR